MPTGGEDWISLVTTLRAEEVLRDIDPDQLPKREVGWLLISCSDGHRFRELFAYHLQTCGESPCHHPLAYPGGAVVLGEGSPLAQTRRGFSADEVMLDGIDESLRIERLGINNIAAYTHFPCSAAQGAQLSPIQQLNLFRSGITRIRKLYPGVSVVPFCHVRHTNGSHRTYWVDFKAYDALRVEHEKSLLKYA